MGTTEEYARLSLEVYEGNQPPPGWVPVFAADGHPFQAWGQHGYYGALFQKTSTGEVAFVSRGTEITKADDLASGLALLRGEVPAQWRDALDLLERADQAGITRESITFTGHSLGGSLSQMLSAHTLRPAVTFNAVPVKRILPKIGQDPDAPYPIADVVDPNDPLAHVGPHVGTRIVLPATALPVPMPKPFIPRSEPDSLEREVARLVLGVLVAHPMASVNAKVRAATSLATPLVLDLDGDGVETTGVTPGVHFDHDADGFAERTAWVGAEDGLLVRELDGNGTIDTGRELFGNQTMRPGGGVAADGYQALADLDQNADGRVDVQDPAFASLRIWQDADGDGMSTSGELSSLPERGIQSIATAHAASTLVDPAGNQHRQVGTFTKVGGPGVMADVWFVTDRMDTIATTWLPVPAHIAALPEAIGFGITRDLSQAATRDPVLEGLLATFVSQTEPAARDATLEQILFRWTGNDGIAPGARGGLIDARRLAVLEAFTGQPFVGVNGPNPNQVAAPPLEAAYHELAEMVYSELTVTSNVGLLYGLIRFSWDDGAQIMRGDLTDVIAELDRRLASDATAGGAVLADFARSLRGLALLGMVDYGAFRDHFATRSETLAWATDSGGKLLVEGTAGPDVLSGGAVADALRGGDGNDQLAGGAGDDLLWGGPGGDRLAGDAGADLLDGGAGNDWLEGGDGDDVYVLRRGSGQDQIQDYDWQTPNLDTVAIQAGIAPGDVEVRRIDDDLVLRIAGTTDEVRLLGWLAEGFGSNYQVQRVTFVDGTVWDVAALKDKALAGTPGPDSLIGYLDADRIDGLDGDDFLAGRGGDDRLEGGSGADRLFGGPDADTLLGGPGADQLFGDPGDDTLDGGPDSDYMDGGFGNDTYVFGRGSGQDTIYDADWQVPSTDRILVAADVSPGLVTVQRVGDDLVLRITDTTDELRMAAWFSDGFPAAFQVQRVEFADGTVWDVAALKQRVLTPTPGADTLVGYGGADRIEGLAGDDSLAGGAGDDRLEGGAGADRLSGGPDADTLLGGLGADQLFGDPGDDTLDGGPDNDFMDGGFGNDTYVFGRGSGQDTIYDSDWQVPSTDRILVAADVSPGLVTVQRDANDLVLRIAGTADALRMASWFNDGFPAAFQVQRVEFADGTVWDVPTLRALAATIAGTAGPDTLVGTSGGDVLRGLAGNDTLYGRAGADLLDGGPGADVVIGEGGDDVYLADDPADLVTEAPGEGLDIVRSTTSFTLGAHVEDLTLTGTAANGTGNDLANTLTGNALANVLDGRGGADVLVGGGGADTLSGGAGDDVYDVDDPLDRVTEAQGGGIDTVRSLVSYVLPANVERLILTGSGAVNGTGNTLANVLVGNGGANVLAGGAGADTYAFGRGAGADTIVETDPSSGATDTLLWGDGIRPIDLVVSRTAKDLKVSLHGSADSVTVQSWYGNGNHARQVETIVAADGSRLSSARVALLIQDMASYCTSVSLTWDQAIDRRPTEVQAVLAAHWLPPA